MIPVMPQFALPDTPNLQEQSQAGFTYCLDLENKRIVGHVDGLEAITQSIYKTLYTERYAYLIYNWDYGMELEQYFGQNFDFIAADIERSIREALQVDDRIQDIQNFRIQKTKLDALQIEFLTVTTAGNTAISWEVKQ